MPKRAAAPPPELRLEARVCVLDRLDPQPEEDRCSDREHREVDEAGDRHRDDDVDPLEALNALLLRLVSADNAVLGQGRMEVDDVRHDRCAQNPRRDEDRLGALEPRHEDVLDGFRRARLREEDLEGEGDDDHADERCDHRFEPAKPVALKGQDPEGTRAGQQPGGEERHAEQKVEAERGAEDLGQVGGHGDRLRLEPEPERHRPAKVVAAGLRQVAAGRDPQLRRERLHQHRHQVRGDDHPAEQVAVLGPARNVRGEVAGVDVGDRGDEGWPEEGPEPADTLALARQRGLGGAKRRCLAGEDVCRPPGRPSTGAVPPISGSRISVIRNRKFRRIEILDGIRAERQSTPRRGDTSAPSLTDSRNRAETLAQQLNCGL